jgi:hypothetical protein
VRAGLRHGGEYSINKGREKRKFETANGHEDNDKDMPKPYASIKLFTGFSGWYSIIRSVPR